MVACGNATLPMRFAGPANLTPETVRQGVADGAHGPRNSARMHMRRLGRAHRPAGALDKKQCYAAAGTLSAAAGLYLIAWVQILSTPDFARREAKVQHVQEI